MPSGHLQSRNDELLEGLMVLAGHAVIMSLSQKKLGGQMVHVVSADGMHGVDIYVPAGHVLQLAHVLESINASDVAMAHSKMR